MDDEQLDKAISDALEGKEDVVVERVTLHGSAEVAPGDWPWVIHPYSGPIPPDMIMHFDMPLMACPICEGPAHYTEGVRIGCIQCDLELLKRPSEDEPQLVSRWNSMPRRVYTGRREPYPQQVIKPAEPDSPSTSADSPAPDNTSG